MRKELDYIMSNDILPAYKQRDDVKEYITHLTRRIVKKNNRKIWYDETRRDVLREKNLGDSAFDSLKSILHDGYFIPSLAGRPAGYIMRKGKYIKMTKHETPTVDFAVCFTEQPIESITRTIYKEPGNWQFSYLEPYGIVFNKRAFFAYGARPVIYGDETVWLILELAHKFIRRVDDDKLKETIMIINNNEDSKNLIENLEAKFKMKCSEFTTKWLSEALYKIRRFYGAPYNPNRIIGETGECKPIDFTHEREWRCFPNKYIPDRYPNEVERSHSHKDKVIQILLPACNEYENNEGYFDDEHRDFKILVKTNSEKEELKSYIKNLNTPPIPYHDEYYEEYYERLKDIKRTPIYSFEQLESHYNAS